MAKYVYNGSDERVFPTLGLSVKPKQEFEAPDDFDAADVSKIASASEKKIINSEIVKGE